MSTYTYLVTGRLIDAEIQCGELSPMRRGWQLLDATSVIPSHLYSFDSDMTEGQALLAALEVIGSYPLIVDQITVDMLGAGDIEISIEGRSPLADIGTYGQWQKVNA